MTPEFDQMFREYDIRGRLNEQELNVTNVYRIATGYARYLREIGVSRAVVGYDNRACSEGFAQTTIDVLRGMGVDVVSIGLCTTPVAYFAQHCFRCDGLAMITASHNPDGWSGFKLGKGLSSTLEPTDIERVHDLALRREPPRLVRQGALHVRNAWEPYVDAVVSRIQMGARRPRMVLDAGNGAAGLFVYEVFQRLGCPAFHLNCDPDMSYPHYFPNPSELRARARLREMVTHPYIHADVGLGFDGDGDRLGVMDEHGGDIWGDTLLILLASRMLATLPGAPVVFDVKCTQQLEHEVRLRGGRPVMWKTGHSLIKAKMREIGAPLAGERSGHIFFGGDLYYGFDDAIFAAAKLVECLSHTDAPLSELVAPYHGTACSPEIRAHCSDGDKYHVVRLITSELKQLYPGRVNDINGARVEFDYGWGLVRASSNLPELVLVFEADTPEHLQEIRAKFRQLLARHPEVSAEWENDDMPMRAAP